MQNRLKPRQEGHAANRETQEEKRPVDASIGCRHEKKAVVKVRESGATRAKAGSIAALLFTADYPAAAPECDPTGLQTAGACNAHARYIN